MNEDRSNGYEAVAPVFIAGRGTRPMRGDAIGVATVRAWAETLPSGATVLDLGCGPGEPMTRVLRDAGLAVFGVDASPSMVAAFGERFPECPVECNTAETSDFFGRHFDAVIAWGLLFLLQPDAQIEIIAKVARSLVPDGRFLFTSPPQPISWLDAMTDRPSRSLGRDVYERLLREEGLLLLGEDEDEGENHYYFATKTGPPSP